MAVQGESGVCIAASVVKAGRGHEVVILRQQKEEDVHFSAGIQS